MVLHPEVTLRDAVEMTELLRDRVCGFQVAPFAAAAVCDGQGRPRVMLISITCATLSLSRTSLSVVAAIVPIICDRAQPDASTADRSLSHSK